jgi:hypothetical protein
MGTIVFAIRLTEADWDETQRAWRCPALNIPGAEIKDIVMDGNRADKVQYEVLKGQALIHWIPSTEPKRVAAVIELTQQLSLVAETDRWEKLAVVLPVVATIIAATISSIATYYSRSASGPPASLAAQPSSDNKPPSPERITADTQFDLAMPRGNKVCLTWKGQPTDGSRAAVLKAAGISVSDYDEGTKIVYAALAKKSPSTTLIIRLSLRENSFRVFVKVCSCLDLHRKRDTMNFSYFKMTMNSACFYFAMTDHCHQLLRRRSA